MSGARPSSPHLNAHPRFHAPPCARAARPETFSPSKVEVLANLKRRQVEKRANSSQQQSRTDVLPDPLQPKQARARVMHACVCVRVCVLRTCVRERVRACVCLSA